MRSVGLPPFLAPCLRPAPFVDFIPCTLVVVSFCAMLLTSSVGAQAVLGLLFFSPSAVTLCRGTPDPTLWRSGSALRPARACWGTCRASSDPWSLGECGQDRGRAPGRVRSPGRSGPGAGSHFRGFVDRPGGRLRGFPTSGRRAPPTPFSPARVTLSLCLLCFGVSVALTNLHGSLGAGWGKACCSDAFARLSGSLVAPRGFGRAGLRPLFFAPSSVLARAGPGPSASSPAGAAGRD